MNATAEANGPEQNFADHEFVDQCFKWLRTTKGEGAIKAIFDDLGEFLERHFATEEAPGGFFDVVLRSSPHYASAVQALRKEHPRLLAEARRIAATLTDQPSPASATSLAEIANFTETLKDHERRESALMQGSHYED